MYINVKCTSSISNKVSPVNSLAPNSSKGSGRAGKNLFGPGLKKQKTIDKMKPTDPADFKKVIEAA